MYVCILSRRSIDCGQRARFAFVEVKQRTQMLVFQFLHASYGTLLVAAAFAVVIIHQSALRLRGGHGPFSSCVIHKEDLCPSSGDINRLMIMYINLSRIHNKSLTSAFHRDCEFVEYLFIYTFFSCR
jgi:hypothetical protein